MQEIPGHLWEMPELSDLKAYNPSTMLVEEFMFTNLFTTRKDDILELVSDMMDWKNINYAPVENKKGELIGLVTSRQVINYFSGVKNKDKKSIAVVNDIMIKNPVTTTPESTIIDAMNLMKEEKLGCLPVVKGKELVGIITEMDFLQISNRLIERSMNHDKPKKKSKPKKKKGKK